MNLLPIHSLRWGILCTVAMMLLIGCKIEPSDQNTPITPETKTSEGDPAETIEDAEAIDESTDEDVMDATAVSVNSEPSEPSKEAQSRKSTEPITLSNGLTAGFTESGQAYIGDINAPVVIEEYSDYQCPFCARFYEGAMTELMSNDIKNGDAVIIFYDFPLTNIHPQAMAASNASHSRT